MMIYHFETLLASLDVVKVPIKDSRNDKRKIAMVLNKDIFADHHSGEKMNILNH